MSKHSGRQVSTPSLTPPSPLPSQVFETNSLEQLLINYANEKLAQLFNELFVESEKRELLQEGLTISPLSHYYLTILPSYFSYSLTI